MSTITAVLRKKPNKQGLYPICVRIIKNRKPTFIYTKQYIDFKHWDEQNRRVKKSHPNSTRLNNLISKKISEANEVVLDDETQNSNLSTQQIHTKVKRKGKNVSFFKLASERIKKKYLKGTFSVAKAELSILHNIQEYVNHKPSEPILKARENIKLRRKERISKGRKYEHHTMDLIKKFSKDNSLFFEDITTPFLEGFKTFCISHLEQKKTRTVTNQLILIRTLYNQAIKEGVVHEKHYPFAGEKEKINIQSGNKIGLNVKQIKSIEDLELESNTSIWHTKNVYLFSYYFAGVRISDVVELKWMNFIDGRLYYEMNKNEKPVSLKIPEKANIILNLYKQDKQSETDYVFPFLKKANQNNKEDIFVKTRNATSLMNKHLKRIAEMCDIKISLSNHISRHSFGNIAKNRISPEVLQKLYRHSNLKTTINYQANFIHKEADDALDMVLSS
ncbi:phage integrase SAM-like domain-containing protein [Tenacibaculum xiamenense]|uniref:phage integrase SAM-like domain-containing protein n=1 Tax=Tenacibaculum xiamenense TaxID=1261553 RepID=UPI003892DA36